VLVSFSNQRVGLLRPPISARHTAQTNPHSHLLSRHDWVEALQADGPLSS
jgi:hypothetical protein